MSRRGARSGEAEATLSAPSRRAFQLALGACIGVLLAGCGEQRGAAHAVSDHPLLGAPAPALELPTADRKEHITLARYGGKVVIVDFWATWCEPCRESFPAYQKLVDEFGGRLVVIGVSVDEDPSEIAAFVASTGVRFPIGWDEGQSAAQGYRPPKMPTSFVIDSNGIVRFVHAGFTPGDENQIREQIRSLL
jgi:cytochrome c biogenesis protein CcmG, thiol:disulfide interchange protein DsbE